MWFTFVTARLFIFLSFQPRLTATLLRSCSVVNNPIRRMGLAPMFKPASPAQASFPPVRRNPRSGECFVFFQKSPHVVSYRNCRRRRKEAGL